VTRLLELHRAGELTLDELAADFRALHWRAVPSACPPGMEAPAAAIDEPEPYVPGSFDDVVRADDLGLLSDTEYGVLAPAAVRGLRNAVRRAAGSIQAAVIAWQPGGR
jgi:hypothetical protein